MKIVAFSGSLRADSFNTSLVRAFEALVPAGVEIEMLSIANLPLFNQEEEKNYPEAARVLKEKVLAADGVLFATPEYNRSIPGVLKNAIDWISRPYGTNPFVGKPTLIAGVSSGKVGAAVAQSHLRVVMQFLDADLIGQPELYIGPGAEVFDASGALLQEATKEVLTKALAALIARATPVSSHAEEVVLQSA